MDVKIVDFPPTTVAYQRYTGPYGPAIADFWDKVFNPWREQHGLGKRVTYGIGLDDPHSTPPEQCRYDACVEVPADYVAPAPASVTTLPGGRYAVARFRGQAHEIVAVWQEFYTKVLPSMHLAPRYAPCFERYDAEYVEEEGGVFECDLFAPVN